MKGAGFVLVLSGCSGCEGFDDTLESGAFAVGEWPCESCDGACFATYEADPASGHVEGDVLYLDEPPYGGDHNPCWATWGAHDESVAAEFWVHNLEHGGVVFLYDCASACDVEESQLEAYTATLPAGRWLLTPYADSEYPFTVLSWGHRLELGCFDLPAMQLFFDQNVANGREDVTGNPGESCL